MIEQSREDAETLDQTDEVVAPAAERLASHSGRNWSLSTFLRVALAAAGAIRRLHTRGMIHKDIKPENILADVAQGKAWLTGLDVVSRLPRERQPPEPPEAIAGTLAYMAPEQTGRMNRSIDSRSDLYSLGVTLYQLLTEQLPFRATDPMELVHCHIARQPPPLTSAVRDIPVGVSNIIMKLLAKTAEDRYQTAAGVEHDLQHALERLQTTGRIDPFVVGSRDVSDRLLIPEKLYGRAAEIEELLTSFGRVVSDGDIQLVLVSGYSGIGKSSVVHELHKALVPPRGLFASGKFDQYKRNIPYATVAQAFQVLVRQVLSKSDNEIGRFRELLTRALGANGQLLVNLVPELELVIGQQPAPPELSPSDAQARFQGVVRRFLGVFARADHPLALFLDDLQWLDTATLELIEHLMGGSEVRHLLLVGAYRDNEVGPNHPLAKTLARLRSGSNRVSEIVLAPLEREDLTALCADSLRTPASAARDLAWLIHEKTAGNPFFAIQFMTALVDERLLRFEPDSGAWRWDVAAIVAKSFTDNIVDLMTAKLDRLPAEARNAVLRLAYLGNQARTETLSEISGVTVDDTHRALSSAVVAGLVLRSPAGYAFLHDRVQEAAYAMLPEAERQAEHLRIGKLLLHRTTTRDLEENVFEIVDQLNRGAALLDEYSERVRVAELNRLAGKRAKGSTAHSAARTYFALGRALLGTNGWLRNFQLTFELELQLADCEFLTADLHSAEQRLEQLGKHALSLPDRAAVIEVQVNLYTAMIDRADKAVEICLRYLELVGIEWSAHPSDDVLAREHAALLARIGGRSFDEFLMLPLLTDPDLKATNEVLLWMFTPAFNTDPRLASLILCRLGNLGLEHGNSDATSLGYAFLGMVLGSVFGDYRTGFSFGKLARDLVEVRGLARYRGRIYHTLGAHVLAWTEPMTSAEASLRRGLAAMQEAGDATYASFGHICLNAMLLGRGEKLDVVQAEVESTLDLVQRGKFDIAIDTCVGQLRLIRALRGELPDPCTLEEGLGFVADYTRLERTRGWYWIRTLQACFIYGDFSAALTAAGRAEPFLPMSMSFIELAEYHFYTALALAATLGDASAPTHAERLSQLASHREQLAVWADHSPMNFSDRVALIDAELARIEGRWLDAIHGYELALRMARERGFSHIEAIVSELAARFFSGRGLETIAVAYLESAHAGYRRWGAKGKYRRLERLHPRVGSQPTGEPGPSLDSIDLQTVVRTSRAVSLQVGVGRVIDSLMVIVLQHAGAERGLLLLKEGDGLYTEAEATTGPGGVSVRRLHDVVADTMLPQSVLQYAMRTRDAVLLDDAQAHSQFSLDPYFSERACRSILCLPLVRQAEVIGALYLENSLTPRAFTPTHLEVLKLLASQAAISLENATLEAKEALLKEVHHRVKNNLQLISSLLSLQASRIKDPAVAELFADSRNRVRSMALVHENLYRAGNFSKIPMHSHIDMLCAQLMRAYGSPDKSVELVVDVGDLHLEMNRAVSCGLIVNELVSNALKHAFSGRTRGRIQIALESTDAGRYALRVADDGIGLPEGLDFGRADSLGLQLVHDLTQQLEGQIEVVRNHGTRFTVTFDESRTLGRT